MAEGRNCDCCGIQHGLEADEEYCSTVLGCLSDLETQHAQQTGCKPLTEQAPLICTISHPVLQVQTCALVKSACYCQDPFDARGIRNLASISGHDGPVLHATHDTEGNSVVARYAAYMPNAP